MPWTIAPELRASANFISTHFLRSQLPVMAAALAYRTIFGMIPVIVIGLVVLGAFASDEQVADTVRKFLNYTGVAGISISEPSMGPPIPADAAAPVAAAVGGGEALIAADSQHVDQWIEQLVSRVRKVPLKTIGFIGIVALIYAAISMLVEVERAFNQVYRAPTGRSWGSRVARYWTMLTLGTLGLVLTFFVGERFQGVVRDLAQQAQVAGITPGGEQTTTWVLTAVGFAVTVSISTLLLLVLYITVPNAAVRVKPALCGAVLAAILWEAGKWGFTTYLRFSASYAQLYGAIALIPLFMLWIYLTWLIVLLGLFLSYAMQTYRDHPLTRAAEGPPPIVEPASILVALCAVAERFGQGQTSDAADVGDATGIDAAVVETMLHKLCEAGVLHKVEKGGERQGYTLARPPTAIDAGEILALGHAMAGTTTKEVAVKAGELLGKVRAAALGATSGKMLVDLVPGLAAPAKPAALSG